MRKLTLLLFAAIVHLQLFAQDVNITVKADVDAELNTKIAMLYMRGSMYREKARCVIQDNKVNIETNITEPSFFILIIPEYANTDVFLNPGDNLTVEKSGKGIIFKGDGAGVNNLLYAVKQNYPYNPKEPKSHKSTYDNRLKTLKECKDDDVRKNRKLLEGYLQGEYLNTIFSGYINSKVFGKSGEINEPEFSDLNIELLPTITSYEGWAESINEIMYLKLKNGDIKLTNITDWVTAFAKEIKNQELRESYIVFCLDRQVIMSGLVNIHETIKASLPLVKNPKNIQLIKELEPRIEKGLTRYPSKVGVDLSQYSFIDREGKKVSISDFKGNYIFIDIWDLGCSPCIAEMPFLNVIEESFHDEKIVFLSITLDTAVEKWTDFLDKRNMKGHQLRMAGGFKDGFFVKIGLSGIPRFVIIDKDGKMCDYNSEKRPSNPLLKIYLNQLLKK